MPASFPGTLRSFPIHVNTTEVIDASHLNELQDEVVALQSFLGTNPHVSSASTGSSLGAWSSSSRTYATLSDRLANTEAGHLADTHSQYVRFSATETITGQKSFTATDTFFGAATGGTSGRVTLSSGTTSGEATLAWRDGTTPRWSLYRVQGGADLFVRDMVNARQHVTYTPGASSTAAVTAYSSSVTVAGNTSLSGTLGVAGVTTLAATTATTLGLSGALTLAAGTGSPATTSAVGDSPAGGTSTTVARADHVHGREAFGLLAAITAVTAGGASAAGAAAQPARSDHAHSLAANVNPTASSVGDAVALGASTAVARADHVHGRESFGASVALPVPDAATTPGTATTPARSDHTHGYTTASAGASSPGDTAAQGAATSLAKSDHRHSRESFGAAPPAVNVTAGTAGAASTLARSDHNHSVSVGSPVALQAFGLGTADGTSTSLARADHSHGSPAAPTAASVGALALTGGTLSGALTVPSPLTINDGTISKATAGAWSLAAPLSVTGTITASTTVTGTTGVYDGVNRVYSTANPPPSAAPVVIMPFFVGGSVGTGLRRPEFLCTVPMTLRGARSRSFAGSGNYTIYVNGANISGTASAFSTTQALFDFADYNVNAGDRVQLNIDTASADAVDLSVTVDVVTR